MELRASQCDTSSLASYAELFKRCFPDARHLGEHYLHWLYRENPAGMVVGFDAWEGEQLAAHYVCIPGDACVGNRSVKVLLSLNTATDPAFQGRGLFTRLAEATYIEGSRQGFQGIYGVANNNSTPGFIRKLGFSLVEPLDALVGIGPLPSVAPAQAQSQASFYRRWNADSLAWRLGNPVRPYRLVSQRGERVGVYAATGKPGLQAWGELPPETALGLNIGHASPGFRLHLGLTPLAARRRQVSWINVPQKLRSSPLNLIYRSLDPGGFVPAGGDVLFGQLDFDAF